MGVSNDICTGLAGYRNKHQRFVEDYGVWTGCGELWGLRLLGCNFRARAAAAKAVTRMEAAYVSTSTHAHPFHLRLSLLFIVFLCWAVSRCFHSVGSLFASYLFHTLFPIHTWGVGKGTVNYQQNPFHSAELWPRHVTSCTGSEVAQEWGSNSMHRIKYGTQARLVCIAVDEYTTKQYLVTIPCLKS